MLGCLSTLPLGRDLRSRSIAWPREIWRITKIRPFGAIRKNRRNSWLTKSFGIVIATLISYFCAKFQVLKCNNGSKVLPTSSTTSRGRDHVKITIFLKKNGPKNPGVRFDEVKTDANAARTCGTCSELNIDSDACVYIAF